MRVTVVLYYTYSYCASYSGYLSHFSRTESFSLKHLSFSNGKPKTSYGKNARRNLKLDKKMFYKRRKVYSFPFRFSIL